jgi:hypothetical protein
MTWNDESVADRIRQVRMEQFGEHGILALSEAMKIPARTWENVEGGVQVPYPILLQFLEVTGADPHWILTGEGDRYRDSSEGPSRQSSR